MDDSQYRCTTSTSCRRYDLRGMRSGDHSRCSFRARGSIWAWNLCQFQLFCNLKLLNTFDRPEKIKDILKEFETQRNHPEVPIPAILLMSFNYNTSVPSFHNPSGYIYYFYGYIDSHLLGINLAYGCHSYIYYRNRVYCHFSKQIIQAGFILKSQYG